MPIKFDDVIDVMNMCFQKVENTKELYIKKNIRKPYLDMVDKILNEINLFNNNLHNTVSKLEKDVYLDNPNFLKVNSVENNVIKLDSENNIDLDILKEYNFNLVNRIKNLKVNSIEEYFEDDIRFL